MRINHNIPALNAHRLLNRNTDVSSTTLERLSSGRKINRAADDAAGMAISQKMKAQVRALAKAAQNTLDGISLIQTAEGAMNEVHSMLQRMRELAVQSSNGTTTDDDRKAIQDEINQLTSEVNRIANGTEFNTRKILQGNQAPNSNTTVHKMSTGGPAILSAGLNGAGSGAMNDKAVIETVSGQKGTASEQTIWNTGKLTALTSGQTGTFEFMGVTISIKAKGSYGNQAGINNVTASGAALKIDSNISGAAQAQSIASGLAQIAEISGSPLDGFKFEVDSNGGIKITGSKDDIYNDEVITVTGNLKTANQQLTTPGASSGGAVWEMRDLSLSGLGLSSS
ncbi:MAG TPA: hypothetical protein VFC70_02775, partial [Oscillospiraceae bacterium]|nr:hypothetical protein [Oscillospiraceae bacterium]